MANMYSRILFRCIAWRTKLLHVTVIKLPCILITFGILKTEAKRKTQIDGCILNVLHIQGPEKNIVYGK